MHELIKNSTIDAYNIVEESRYEMQELSTHAHDEADFNRINHGVMMLTRIMDRIYSTAMREGVFS